MNWNCLIPQLAWWTSETLATCKKLLPKNLPLIIYQIGMRLCKHSSICRHLPKAFKNGKSIRITMKSQRNWRAWCVRSLNKSVKIIQPMLFKQANVLLIFSKVFLLLFNTDIEAYGYGSRMGVSPQKFKRVFSWVYPMYRGRDQKDGYEFMMFLLEALSSDLNRAKGPHEYRIINYKNERTLKENVNRHF